MAPRLSARGGLERLLLQRPRTRIGAREGHHDEIVGLAQALRRPRRQRGVAHEQHDLGIPGGARVEADGGRAVEHDGRRDPVKLAAQPVGEGGERHVRAGRHEGDHAIAVTRGVARLRPPQATDDGPGEAEHDVGVRGGEIVEGRLRQPEELGVADRPHRGRARRVREQRHLADAFGGANLADRPRRAVGLPRRDAQPSADDEPHAGAGVAFPHEQLAGGPRLPHQLARQRVERAGLGAGEQVGLAEPRRDPGGIGTIAPVLGGPLAPVRRAFDLRPERRKRGSQRAPRLRADRREDAGLERLHGGAARRAEQERPLADDLARTDFAEALRRAVSALRQRAQAAVQHEEQAVAGVALPEEHVSRREDVPLELAREHPALCLTEGVAEGRRRDLFVADLRAGIHGAPAMMRAR